MGDARVMAEEASAAREALGEFEHGEILREGESFRRQIARQSAQSISLGLAADEQERRSGFLHEGAEEFGPVGFKPVLALAAGTGMEGE